MEVSRIDVAGLVYVVCAHADLLLLCADYIDESCHGQDQLQKLHIPEAEAQIGREEEEIKALKEENNKLFSELFGGVFGTSLAAHGMLPSKWQGTCVLCVPSASRAF